eukprot:7674343-Karenia_brevis.AAC.1
MCCGPPSQFGVLTASTVGVGKSGVAHVEQCGQRARSTTTTCLFERAPDGREVQPLLTHLRPVSAKD